MGRPKGPSAKKISKAAVFKLLDEIYATTGYRPTLEDARDCGYSGGNKHYYCIQAQWLIKHPEAKRRPPGNPIANPAQYIPKNIDAEAKQARKQVKGWPKPEAELKDGRPIHPVVQLSPIEEAVKLYKKTWRHLHG